MRTDIAYEVTDMRTNRPWPLGPVGIITEVPNGLYVDTNNRRYVFMDFTDDPDEDGRFVDRWEEGIVELHTPDGLVLLTRLRLANYRDRVYPYLHANHGPFATDDAVSRYFFDLIHGMD